MPSFLGSNKPSTPTISEKTTSSSITINWKGPQDSTITVKGYQVLWIPPDNDGSKDVTDGSTSTKITGLIPNTGYTISVAVIDSDGRIGEASDPLTETTRELIKITCAYYIL